MKICRSLLVMSLAAVTACLPLLGTTGAILSPMAATVAVNGQAVTAGSAVVAGDVVATSAQGSARMVLPGASLIAASNTQFRMENLNHASAVRLNSGLVKITGLLPVEVNTSTVIPGTAQTRFNVYATSGKIYVSALAGHVAVTLAKSTTVVPVGSTAVLAAPTPAPAAGQLPATAYVTSGVSWAVTAGIAAAAGVVTGVVVYKATKCTNGNGTACVSSPAQ